MSLHFRLLERKLLWSFSAVVVSQCSLNHHRLPAGFILHSRSSLFIRSNGDKLFIFSSSQTTNHPPTGTVLLPLSLSRSISSVVGRSYSYSPCKSHPLHNYIPFSPKYNSESDTLSVFYISFSQSNMGYLDRCQNPPDPMSVFNFQFSADASAFPFIGCVPLFGIQFSSPHSLIKIESKFNLCHHVHSEWD